MTQIHKAFRPFFPVAAILVAVLAVGCASGAAVVTGDMSYEELVQRAQEASDAYRHEAALDYYAAALERFGSDPAIKVACDYEIAFLQYKTGDYESAAAGLSSVVARYDAPGGESLPPQYRILAAKVLPTVLGHMAGGEE
ncbi:MAG: hypothetical protein JXA15_03520 [Spirochaetales bacterium]|nr:hypothetical protein [Spirochaetales bacterium]